MSSARANSRYQITDSLGRGGMGDVFVALDRKSDPPREVALKTIRDINDPAALELFKRECNVLMSFNHPNVIEIYESGDIEQGDVIKPFFVMARLHGVTLAEIIKDSPQRLTVDRTIEIISQVCRGLQAAHDHDLVHRDIKPSNIFVMEDDSVKVIDFGVAHLVSLETLGAKGTLHYMAPEQFLGLTVDRRADIFSLGVVCFEALTRKRPFTGSTDEEIRRAILKDIPPPVSTLNPAVNSSLSQVIHAAMAKKPVHRFDSVREFGECLKKALRNEPIERFDTSNIRPRLTRVEKALENSEYEFADGILTQLEEEGYLHPSISELRRQVSHGTKNRDVRQFLESARRFFKEEELLLALQKVQEVLQLDPNNPEALDLKARIEEKRSAQQMDNWLNLAQQHLDNFAFGPAREAIESALRVSPTDKRVLLLRSAIDRVEQTVVRKRQEKERHFESVLQLRDKGDLTAALSRLERLLELDRELPDAMMAERGAEYRRLYNEVRSESEGIRNALEEAKRQLEAGNYSGAESICDTYLEKYQNHALFQGLKWDISERQRQALSAYIANIDRQTSAEPDLQRKSKILEEALSRYPGEVHFERALKDVSAKLNMVNGLVDQAQNLEDRGQYQEAIDKWEMLRAIYKQHPGLEVEIDRLRRRANQHTRSEARSRWIERIDSALNSGEYAQALQIVQDALAEFPDDPQLAPLERLASQRVEQSERAQELLERGHQLLNAGSLDEALVVLREANGLDEHNAVVRAVFVESLLNKASAIVDTNTPDAGKLIDEAFNLDAANPRVKSMRLLVADLKKTSAVDQYLSRARELQAATELEAAASEVARGLSAFPGDARLIQLQTVLARTLDEEQRQTELRLDRSRILELRNIFDHPKDNPEIRTVFDASVVIAQKHPRDEQIQLIAGEIEREVQRRNRDLNPEKKDAAGTERFEEGNTEPAEIREDKASAFKKAVIAFGVLWKERLRSSFESMPRRTRVYSAIGFALVFVLGLALVGLKLRNTTPTAPIPTPGPVAVNLEISPSEATVSEKDHDFGLIRQFPLDPGVHTLTVSAAGYEPKSIDIHVTPAGADNTKIELSPLSTLVEIERGSTDIKINGENVDESSLPKRIANFDQEQTVQISNKSSGGQGSFSFVAKIASMPGITTPPVWPNSMVGVIVASFANQVRIYGPRKAKLDDQTEQDVPLDGLLLTIQDNVLHNLLFKNDGDWYQTQLQTSDTPKLILSIPNPTEGRIRISSNQPEAEILIRDAVSQKEVSKGTVGKGRILPLKPGDYIIRGRIDGFLDSTPPKVTIKAGQTQVVDFNFISRYATLEIHGVPAGARVMLDSSDLGTAGSDGTLRRDTIDPGNHTISLQAPRTIPVPKAAAFVAGQTTSVDARDLFKKQGHVSVSCSAPGCVITQQLEGAARATRINAGEYDLAEGKYTFAGSAQGFNSDIKPITVQAEPPQVVSLSPTPIVAPQPRGGGPPPPPPPPPVIKPTPVTKLTPACAEKQGIMECKDGAGLSASQGTYTFEVVLDSGNKLVSIVKNSTAKWTIAFDTNKRVEFTLSDDSFEIDPKNIPGAKKSSVPIKMGKVPSYTIELVVTEGSLRHTIKANGQSKPVSWEIPAEAKLTAREFKLRGDNKLLTFQFLAVK